MVPVIPLYFFSGKTCREISRDLVRHKERSLLEGGHSLSHFGFRVSGCRSPLEQEPRPYGLNACTLQFLSYFLGHGGPSAQVW